MSATTTTNAVRPQAKRSIGVRYTPVSTNEATVAETLEELNDLIGLKPVKDELARFAKTMLSAEAAAASAIPVRRIH